MPERKWLIRGSIAAGLTAAAVGFTSGALFSDDLDWFDGVRADGERGTDFSEAAIGPAEAVRIALAEVPGTWESVELDRFNGTLAFEVDISDADVIVDAATGEVLAIEADDRDGDEPGLELPATAITLDEAIEAARRVTDGPIDEVELEQRGADLVYAIDAGDVEVVVSAIDGTVLQMVRDD